MFYHSENISPHTLWKLGSHSAKIGTAYTECKKISEDSEIQDLLTWNSLLQSWGITDKNNKNRALTLLRLQVLAHGQACYRLPWHPVTSQNQMKLRLRAPFSRREGGGAQRLLVMYRLVETKQQNRIFSLLWLNCDNCVCVWCIRVHAHVCQAREGERGEHSVAPVKEYRCCIMKLCERSYC